MYGRMCVHFKQGLGRGMTLHQSSKEHKRSPDKDQVSGEDSTKPSAPFSGSSSAHTAKLCVKWPAHLLPDTGIGQLSWPKAAINTRWLGVSQWYENIALKGPLHWVAPPRNSLGNSKETQTHRVLEVALSSKEATSASVLLGAGC